jgi:hypothetical protein
VIPVESWDFVPAMESMDCVSDQTTNLKIALESVKVEDHVY